MPNGLKIFAGNANIPLANSIARYAQQSLGKISVFNFKDGEVCVRIEENVRGCDVFVIQPTSKYVNHNLMELAIIIDALKRASAARITAVIPYYGYARQDRKARGREPITAKLVANLITTAGADRVLTIDLHAEQIQGFFDIPLDNLTCSSLFASYLRDKNLKNITVIAPDAGGAKKARILAKILDAPLAIIDKRRDKPNEVAKVHVIGEVKGRNCIIIDDMIDTAGTVAESAKALKKKGAKTVYVCATHGIFSPPAKDRLKERSIKEIVITDTIQQKGKKLDNMTVLSVAPLLGEAIIRVHEEKSISELFDTVLQKPYRKLTNY